jgi:hypothetical protein
MFGDKKLSPREATIGFMFYDRLRVLELTAYLLSQYYDKLTVCRSIMLGVSGKDGERSLIATLVRELPC